MLQKHNMAFGNGDMERISIKIEPLDVISDVTTFKTNSYLDKILLSCNFSQDQF